MTIDEGVLVTVPIGLVVSVVFFIAFVAWTLSVYHHRIEKNKNDIQAAFGKIKELAENVSEMNSWETKAAVNLDHIREQCVDLKNEIVSLRERIDMVIEQKRG